MSLAAGIQKTQPKNATILVSKDINLRIKADALGLMAEDYETDRVFITDLYTGMIDLTAPPDKMAAFRANGELELNGGKTYFPNEYLHTHRRDESQKSRADESGPDRHEADSHH